MCAVRQGWPRLPWCALLCAWCHTVPSSSRLCALWLPGSACCCFARVLRSKVCSYPLLTNACNADEPKCDPKYLLDSLDGFDKCVFCGDSCDGACHRCPAAAPICWSPLLPPLLQSRRRCWRAHQLDCCACMSCPACLHVMSQHAATFCRRYFPALVCATSEPRFAASVLFGSLCVLHLVIEYPPLPLPCRRCSYRLCPAARMMRQWYCWVT